MTAESPTLPRLNVCLLLSSLVLLSPRATRAEDAVSYKYQDYQESGGRVGVQAHYALIEKDLGPATRVKLQGVIDSIAGATPSGVPAPAGSDQVPLSQMSDRRKAWNFEIAHQLPRVNVSAGFANSRESDYVSNGWSLNTVVDFNQKNTTLLLGYAGTDDDVEVFFQPARKEKRGTDVIAGITQLLDPQTSVTLNVTWGRLTGYLGDPYRLIRQTTEIVPGLFLPLTFPENRPDEREKLIVYGALNRSVAQLNGAVEATYRYYRDDFGIRAHTAELAWFQKFGERFILRPAIRFYDQSEADFYFIHLDNASFTATERPTGKGPFYSSDYRLAAFRSYNFGLKAIWTITDHLTVDAAFERYEMDGRDGQTPESAFPRATIVTAGAKFTW